MRRIPRLGLKFAIIIGSVALPCFLPGTLRAGENATASIDTPLPAPGMGWSTFNYFIANHNEALVQSMAQAFAKSGLRDAGYNILRIDGGWWGDDGSRRHWYWTESTTLPNGVTYSPGDPHVDPGNYPRGLKALADDLHGQGFKLGFYLSPSISMGLAENYPQGKPTKVMPSVSGLELLRQHAEFVADSGIDHLFYDGYDWNENQGLEPYTEMFRALRAQAKRVRRPIVFSINSGWKARPGEWADEWRTSGDINADWPRIMECLGTIEAPIPASGKGKWNNPDYLMVGFSSDIEARSQMSLWCVTGSPLYLSFDFRVINDWDRYVLLNTEAIAVDQDAKGDPGRLIARTAVQQTWMRRLSDGSVAVVLLNPTKLPAALSVTLAELGLLAGPVQIRDLWAHRFMEPAGDKLTFPDVAGRDCIFLRIWPTAQPVAEPAPTWARHPGARPALRPLTPGKWTFRSDLFQYEDPAKLFDGNADTGCGGYAIAGKSVEVDFGELTKVDRMVVDNTGVGPNPWPYQVYAPRSSFRLEASPDGTKYEKISEGTFGPTYTISEFKPLMARSIRLVLTEVDKTGVYQSPRFSAREIFFFDGTAVGSGK